MTKTISNECGAEMWTKTQTIKELSILKTCINCINIDSCLLCTFNLRLKNCHRGSVHILLTANKQIRGLSGFKILKVHPSMYEFWGVSWQNWHLFSVIILNSQIMCHYVFLQNRLKYTMFMPAGFLLNCWKYYVVICNDTF